MGQKNCPFYWDVCFIESISSENPSLSAKTGRLTSCPYYILSVLESFRCIINITKKFFVSIIQLWDGLQSKGKKNFLRVILPDGTSAIIAVESGTTLKDCLSDMCRSKNISLTSYDVTIGCPRKVGRHFETFHRKYIFSSAMFLGKLFIRNNVDYFWFLLKVMALAFWICFLACLFVVILLWGKNSNVF